MLLGHAFGQVRDSSLAKLSSLAEKGHYAEAENYCRQLIGQFPQNTDYQVYYARLKSWQKQYDEALKICHSLLAKDSSLTEVYDVASAVSLWAGNCTQAEAFAALGLKKSGDKKTFLMHRAKALSICGRHDEALMLAEELRNTDPTDASLRNFYLREYDLTHPNQFTLRYLHVPDDNWNFGTAEYLRKSKRMSWLGRVTYGTTYSTNYHVEAESYPILSSRSYGFIGVGMSPDNGVFPLLKLGAEYYHTIRRKLELSAGGRYMKFKNDDVSILHLQAAIYLQRWMITARPFVVLQNSKPYAGANLGGRLYSRDGRKYLNIIAGYGLAPYVMPIFEDVAVRLKSTRFGLEYFHMLPHGFAVKPLVLYEYEEFFPGMFRNRLNLQLGISKFLR